MTAEQLATLRSYPHRRLGPGERNLIAYLWSALQQWRLIGRMARVMLQMTYQQTVLGPVWLLIRVLLPTLGMAAVFKNFTSFQIPDLPYPLFLVAGMALWISFDIGLRRGVRSLNVLRRIHRIMNIPRITVTFASFAVPALYHVIFVAFLAIAISFYWLKEGQLFLVLSWNLLYAPVATALTFMITTGIIAVSSVIFLLARDIRLTLPMLTQLWFFLTPIIYPLSALPPTWQTVSLYLNPMTGIVSLYRYALFGTESIALQPLLVNAAMSIFIFLFGVWFMMRSDWILREVV
jgi:lipopolysaccharide transport system permease protein